MSIPYEHADADGDVLSVTAGDEGYAHVKTPAAGVCVSALDIDGLVAALYEAAGCRPPVMLARPALEPTRSWRCKGMEILLTRAGGIVVWIGGSAEALSPSGARRAAAVLAALADKVGDPEPGAAAALQKVIEEAGLVAGDTAGLAGLLAGRGCQLEEAR